MRDYAQDVSEREFELPVVLLVGTSMSAGKTTSAKVIVRLLREAGLVVIGTKLTGADATGTSLLCRMRGLITSSISWTPGSLRPWSRRGNTVVPAQSSLAHGRR